MTIQEIARQAADAEWGAWQQQKAFTTEDPLLVHRVADAVAVAVLQYVHERPYANVEGWLKEIAAFSPAEPPQTTEPWPAPQTTGIILDGRLSGESAPLPPAVEPDPLCEHCDLPLVCASATAERIHGLEVMHAEALTRAEQAEAALATTEAETLKAIRVADLFFSEMANCTHCKSCAKNARQWSEDFRDVRAAAYRQQKGK